MLEKGILFLSEKGILFLSEKIRKIIEMIRIQNKQPRDVVR